ncbi:hypothetical protein AB0B31_35575 [Catellatospora citrea]|uniref:hypothetical protein n=1 Tax=Catellatospora citrea TaxID=53366 RepID=UPI003402DA88
MLLPALIPALIVTSLADVVAAGGDAPIIDGTFVIAEDNGWSGWGRLAIMVTAWLVAMTAGAVAGVGVLRGVRVSPLRSLWAAAGCLPLLAAELVVVGLGVAAWMWVAASVAGFLGVGGPPGQLLGLLALIAAAAAAAVAASHLMFTLIGTVLERNVRVYPWRHVRQAAVPFLLGGVLPGLVPAAVAGAGGESGLVGSWSWLVRLAETVLLTGMVAVQAMLLARGYLWLAQAEAADGPTEDPMNAVDARLASWAPRHTTTTIASAPEPATSGGAWISRLAALPAVLALAAPTVVVAAVNVWNPYSSITIETSALGQGGYVRVVGWSAEGNPVLSTPGRVVFCHDPVCDRGSPAHGGPETEWMTGTVTLAPDGDALKIGTSGSAESGGPFLHYARCTPGKGRCAEQWLAMRGSAKEEFAGWSMFAGTPGRDGGLLFALATPEADGERRAAADSSGWPTAVRTRLRLIRCPDFECARPQRHDLGTISRVDPSWSSGGRTGRLVVDADGTPHASFRIDGGYVDATCAPVTCADPQIVPVDDPYQADFGPIWSVISTSAPGKEPFAGPPGAAADAGRLDAAGTRLEFGPDSALTLAGHGTYAVTAERITRRGLHISLGGSAGGEQVGTAWRWVLWHCAPGCHTPDRTLLDVTISIDDSTMAPPGVQLVPAPDGRILLLRADRTLLIPIPA